LDERAIFSQQVKMSDGRNPMIDKFPDKVNKLCIFYHYFKL